MTKASQIMSLYSKGLSDKEIAERVGCGRSYVRVVARQRKGGAQSDHDRRYLASALGRLASLRQASKTGYKKNAYRRALYATGDVERARERARQVYAAARAMGKTRMEAVSLANTARWRSLTSTGNKTIARKAYAEARP